MLGKGVCVGRPPCPSIGRCDQVLGVLLLRAAEERRMNVMVETSGRDIGMFEYVEHLFPSDSYRKRGGQNKGSGSHGRKSLETARSPYGACCKRPEDAPDLERQLVQRPREVHVRGGADRLEVGAKGEQVVRLGAQVERCALERRLCRRTNPSMG